MNNLSTLSPELDQASEPVAHASVVTSFQPARIKNSASHSGGVLSANFVKLWVVGLCLVLGFASQATQAAEMATVEIVARDGRLYPERLEVPAGVKLKLTLRNEGKTPVEIETGITAVNACSNFDFLWLHSWHAPTFGRFARRS